MSETVFALLHKLADGKFHSGESLGKALGISRAAVWKALQQCEALGVELHSVRGKGYRLSEPLELLEQELLRQKLNTTPRKHISLLEIHQQIDSTNHYLMDAAAQGAPSGAVCLAEQQSHGRGRRGRNWVSPYGTNLYLSFLWRFAEGTTRLGGLSLATGVALMRAFNKLSIDGLALKWPNDVVNEHGKVAGILIEVAGESTGACHAVIGVGVNVAMPATVSRLIDQPWGSIRQHNPQVGRNRLAAVVLDELVTMLIGYEIHGFEAFKEEWRAYDSLAGKSITVSFPNKTICGTACGIDDNGMLLVEHDGGISAYASGEVTVRRRADEASR